MRTYSRAIYFSKMWNISKRKFWYCLAVFFFLCGLCFSAESSTPSLNPHGRRRYVHASSFYNSVISTNDNPFEFYGAFIPFKRLRALITDIHVNPMNEYRFTKVLRKTPLATFYKVVRHKEEEAPQQLVKVIDLLEYFNTNQKPYYCSTVPDSDFFKFLLGKALQEILFFMSTSEASCIAKIERTFLFQHRIFIVFKENIVNDTEQTFLYDIKETLLQPAANHVLKQVTDLLVYLKSKNIVHRNIQPYSFVISSFEGAQKPNLLLVDFSAAMHYDRAHKVFGTVSSPSYYVPPEGLAPGSVH